MWVASGGIRLLFREFESEALGARCLTVRIFAVSSRNRTFRTNRNIELSGKTHITAVMPARGQFCRNRPRDASLQLMQPLYALCNVRRGIGVIGAKRDVPAARFGIPVPTITGEFSILSASPASRHCLPEPQFSSFCSVFFSTGDVSILSASPASRLEILHNSSRVVDSWEAQIARNRRGSQNKHFPQEAPWYGRYSGRRYTIRRKPPARPGGGLAALMQPGQASSFGFLYTLCIHG
ncbi:hypothetical protein BDV95DRAFT_589964 [Massariosphaeria phaeospora]|uniref:Uncharacterized protein n=1 Tax=Massariosphaeria phaeospora TaxID=100035 RepID=A0A7C8IE48_9PLEO|nr:hypothetical protein BDV95DRAFT_589964 [Massariosphaeria phaeospora]